MNSWHRGLKGKTLPSCSTGPRISLVVQISIPHDPKPVRAACYQTFLRAYSCLPKGTCFVCHSTDAVLDSPSQQGLLISVDYCIRNNLLGVLTILCGTHNAQACKPTPIVSKCSSVFVLVKVFLISFVNYVGFL